MIVEYEIIALLGTANNYKVWIRKLSDNSVKTFDVTNTFVQTCIVRYPSSVFQKFKDVNNAVDWENSTVDSDKLLECVEKFNEDNRSTSDGRMNLGEKH